jgi:hypothetical protein
MDEPSDKIPSPSRLSKTPSWVSLGFVIGALFVWSLPRESRTTGTAGESSASRGPVVQLARPKATDIEAVFAEWGRYAVWDNDLTEVALWDVDRKSYTIFYEILRSGDASYFRSIPRLTRPILTHGVPHGCPLQFTETEEQRREWLARDVTAVTTGDGK